MQSIANYRLKSKLTSSTYYYTYRGERHEDKAPFIIKFPKKDRPNVEEITHLEHEYLMMKKMLPGVLHPQDFIQHEKLPVLILKHSEGISLKDYLRSKSLTLKRFFKLAIQLTDIIINLHKNNIVHKDITPANILIDPKTLHIQMLDLSFSTQLTEEMIDYFNLDKFEGSPAYMSPEQTGRINRPIDYRTDLYSLGITLFEMLTDRLPFLNQETLELVHCHLAKKPPKASQLKPQIPEVLSQILDKLMSKLPEQRYASAVGLKADLLTCQAQWNKQKQIESFALGTQDIYDKLHTSRKIYGRENEIEALNQAIEAVTMAKSQMVFITGYSGIGKSSLVREAHKTIPLNNTYFIQGKFEQHTRGTPYSAFIEAFQGLEKKLLTESDAQLKPLKEKLKSNLDNLGQVILNLLPGFEAIISAQTDLDTLSAGDMQNRFINAFNKFISAFNDTNRVLIIFLDDLHWADSASLKLIEYLLTNNFNARLLIIGAYRDNEVDENHPLQLTKNKLIEAGVSTQTLTLGPLKQEHVTALMADTLRLPINKVEELSSVVGTKTGSNPFFINEFLKTICHEDLIYYSHNEREWCWDIQKISEHPMTDNVIDLLSKSLGRLSAGALEMLCLSACIGYRFDLRNLAIISKRKHSEIKKALWEAVQLNFIMPLNNPQSVDMFEAEDKFSQSQENIEYRFIHDRVQQAVYHSLSQSQRKLVHHEIASILLTEKALTFDDDRLFLITNHMNECLDIVNTSPDKATLAKYFLWAGTRAKDSVAFETATNYLNSGIQLIQSLPADEKAAHESLIFDLYKKQAECCYITGQLQEAQDKLDYLLKSHVTKLQEAEAYSLKILAYTVESKHQLCIENGIRALKALNVHIPEHPNMLQIAVEILKTIFLLHGRNIAKIIDQFPVTKDPVQSAKIFLLLQIVGSAYSINPNLVAYCIAKSTYLSLKNGIALYTNLIGYGILLMYEMGLVKLGFQFFQAQDKQNQMFNSPLLKVKYYCGRALFFDHWFFPIAVGMETANIGYQMSVSVGDSAFAGYGKFAMIYYVRAKGTSLNDLDNEIQSGFVALKYIHDAEYYHIILLEKSIHTFLTTGAISHEEIYDSYHQLATKVSYIVQRYGHISFGQFQFLIGNKKEAFRLMNEADKLVKFSHAFIWNQDLWAIFSILIVDEYPNMSFKDKIKYRYKLFKLSRLLKRWAKVCPANLLHKHLLVQAEIKRLKGNYMAAGDLYDAAIKSANENNFYQYVGIINERVIEMYLHLSKPHFAKQYLLEAYYAYKNWGAHNKCKMLETQYPDLLALQGTESIVQHASSLDLAAILKANQVISRERNLNKILEKIMYVALEEAGAETSTLLRKQNDNWVIEAKQDTDTLEIFDQNVQPAMPKDVPLNLVTYVLRTKQPLVIQDILHSHEITQDEYLNTKKPKSVIALPIFFRNEIKRILYLENNTVNNAFTNQQISSLKILASQVAISLENADYYEKSGRFVPFEFLDKLNRNSLIDIRLGDQVKQSLSILFCHIRDFSSLSEQLTPEETLTFINQFWKMLEPIISAHNGFIDKHIGERIMVLFPDPPDQAIQASLEILKVLDKFNEQSIDQNKPAINIGIGINTGDVILGIVGTAKHMTTTVMGDVVNIASRVEELTNKYNTPILISQTTKRMLTQTERFDLKMVDRIIIRGTSNLTEVWEIRLKELEHLH